MILAGVIQVRGRTKIARVFMYFTKWFAIAACRCLDVALKIAPWLQGTGVR
jgi:hypothetical protein